MKVLVTGASGMLGRDLVLAAGNAGHDVVGFGHTELDVTDRTLAEGKLEAERPDLVINAAAWTDVDGAEEAEEEAMAVNGTAAGHLAAAAHAVGAGIVYVSTDYVFDGEKGAPYVESDQPAPLSAYGRTKLAGEEAVVAANKRHFIVRSAGLFGIGGRNFVDTMLRLAATQSEVTVVRDQIGSPTYTWHLAYGIVRLIEGIEYGIHHMAAAGQCSWYEFANEISSRPRLSAGRSRSPARNSAPRRPVPPSRPWSASANTRSGCPAGRTAWQAISPNDKRRQTRNEIVGHRRGRIHRLHLRAAGRRRARRRRPRQAHLRRAAREPARGVAADRGGDRGPRGRPRGDAGRRRGGHLRRRVPRRPLDRRPGRLRPHPRDRHRHPARRRPRRSEEHTSELQSRSDLVC